MIAMLLIIIGCTAISVLAWTFFNRPRESHYSLEIQRIDRSTQDAKDRMRQSSQRVEDQLRRLSKWQ